MNQEWKFFQMSSGTRLRVQYHYDELKSALKEGKNGQSPASDGFGYEFYKVFFKDLSWFLLPVRHPKPISQFSWADTIMQKKYIDQIFFRGITRKSCSHTILFL